MPHPSHPAPLLASRANPRVKQLRAAFSGHARLSGGLIAIEGDHLLEEALLSNMAIKTVFLTEHRPLPAYLPHNLEILRLSSEAFSSAVETRSPQGIAALLVPPPEPLLESFASPPTTPLILVAAGLQDPGNLGTLIRSAEAFGASGLLTSPATVSPWNQKSLRASAGSIFRLPLRSASPDDLRHLRSLGIRLIAAVPPTHGATHAPLSILARPSALLIGNEGAGLSPDLLALADDRISIPIPGPVESLNAAVAGSLLLYEASRQRQHPQLQT